MEASLEAGRENRTDEQRYRYDGVVLKKSSFLTGGRGGRVVRTGAGGSRYILTALAVFLSVDTFTMHRAGVGRGETGRWGREEGDRRGSSLKQ